MTLFQETLPFVSLVVPVRNEEKLIEGCLESLLRQDYPSDRIEIIAVDNGSTDRSAVFIKKYPVRYLFEPRWGAAAARNRGGREATGEFLAFVDADCVLPENWVPFLVRWFLENPTSMLANGRTLGNETSLISRYSDFRGRAFFESKESSSRPPLQPPWLITTNLMIRRSIFEEVGGFEESLLPGEDMDLSWRAGLLGHLPKFFPDLVVRERRPCPLLFLWKKSGAAGRATFFLGKRYAPVFQKTFGSRKGQRTFVRKWMRYFREIFFEYEGLSRLRRLAFLFIGCTTHAAFLGGKLRAYTQTEILRVPSPVPVLSAELGRHPLPRSFGLSPEDRLLYLTSLSDSEGVSDHALNCLVQEIDPWGPFLTKALPHRLLPRVYLRLKKRGGQNLMGEKNWKLIERSHFRIQTRMLAHDAELAELLPVLEGAGVKVLLLKGTALNQTVFRNSTLRHAVDLDLMIRPVDLDRTRAILEERGYRDKPAAAPLPSEWHAKVLAFEKKRNAFPFVHETKGVHLDLHLEAIESHFQIQIPREWLWEDSIPCDVSGCSVLLPEPNRLLLFHLLHLIKHASQGENVFGWYLDLDACLRFWQKEIDARFVLGLIKNYFPGVKALEVLTFLKEHFSTPLPPLIEEEMRIRGVSPLPLNRIFSQARREDLESFLHPVWFDRRRHFLQSWREVSGIRNRAVFILKWIFPSGSYLESKYPFGSLSKKTWAYGRHFLTLSLKGIGLTAHLLSPQRRLSEQVKNRYNETRTQKKESPELTEVSR